MEEVLGKTSPIQVCPYIATSSEVRPYNYKLFTEFIPTFN